MILWKVTCIAQLLIPVKINPVSKIFNLRQLLNSSYKRWIIDGVYESLLSVESDNMYCKCLYKSAQCKTLL